MLRCKAWVSIEQVLETWLLEIMYFGSSLRYIALVCIRGLAEAWSSPMQKADEGRVPLEVHSELKHDRRGLLSMARHADPQSGGTSFSIMLNPAPHLDMEYTIFGSVSNLLTRQHT